MNKFLLFIRASLFSLFLPLSLAAWLVWTLLCVTFGGVMCVVMFAFTGDWEFGDFAREFLWIPVPMSLVRDIRDEFWSTR